MAWVLGLLLACASILWAQEPLPDPLPLERFIVPPGRIPAELAKERQGILVQMPLSEFEALVQQASAAQRKNKLTPNLVRSSYKAELKGNDLAGGGTWVVHYSGSGPALLPLPSLNLALKNVREKNNADAILAETDGRNLALIVGTPGPSTVTFDWSAHGTTSPGGLHFELKLPACPLTSLDLILPADHVVALPPAVALVSGPHEMGDPQRRLWRLSLTGKGQVKLDIRPLAGSSDLPQSLVTHIVSRQDSTQEVTPEKVKADFDFQVDLPHYPVRELVFDCDPSLAPYEVSLSNAEVRDWQLVSAPAPAKGKPASPARLTLQLREPFQGTLTGLRIRCLAPRPADGSFSSPYLRLHQALARGETLKIKVHPDVPLENWDPGSFRLLSTAGGADGSLILTLVDPRTVDPRLPAPLPRRPGFLGKLPAGDLHVAQETWWHLGPQGATLTSELIFGVAHGSVYQLRLKLPAGGKDWRVEKVDLEPAELLQGWSILGQEISVDLRSGITPRTSAKLTVRLHSAWDLTSALADKVLDFPDVEPIGATQREGNLHVGIDPIFQASVLQASAPAGSSNQDGPWGTPPNFSFAFRDRPTAPARGQPVVSGKVRLIPSSSRLQASNQTQVLLTPQSVVSQARLELDPVIGSLDYCDIIVTGAGKGTLKAALEKSSTRTMTLQKLTYRERLPWLLSLGSRTPLSLFSLQESLGHLQQWRLRFTPALTQRETVLLEMPATKPLGRSWDVPMFSLMNTPQRQGDVVLLPSGVAISHTRTHGLVQAQRKSGKVPDPHRFSVSGQLLPTLHVDLTPTETVLSVQEHINRARLASHVLEDGRAFHHLSFHAANWHGKELPIILPDPRTHVLGAKVAGRWLTNFPLLPLAKGREVRVPAPFGATGHQIDIYYTSPAAWSGWHGWAGYDVAWPILPTQPLVRERALHLAPGLAPLRRDHWLETNVPEGGDSPALDLVSSAWHLGDSVLDSWLPGKNDDQRQLQILHDAEIALRKKWGKKFEAFSFAEALELMLFDHVKDQVPMTIDAAGLAEAGIGPGTPVGPAAARNDEPFWESLDLALVPGGPGVLLTTRRKKLAWQNIAARLDRPVTQALDAGCDRHGSLQNAGYWLRHAADSAHPGSAANNLADSQIPSSLFADRLPPGWSSWQPYSDRQDEPELAVIRAADVRWLAFGLGAFTLLLGLRAWRDISGLRFFRGLLTWTTVWGLAMLWFPSSFRPLAIAPLVVGLAFGLVAYLLLLVRGLPSEKRRGISTQTMVRGLSSITPAGLILLVCFGMPWAQAGGGKDLSNTVLILQGKETPDKAGQAMALVAPDLIQRLKDLSRGPLDGLTDALLIRGDYRGQVNGGVAHFQAQFDIYCAAENATLVLPLTLVDLQEGSTLDGKAVLPSPNAGPAGGYKLAVPGKGFHRLNLSFTTRPRSVADFQELRFGIPRSPQTHVHLSAPPTWQEMHVPFCQGEVAIVPVKGQQEMQAELGRESALAIRFRHDTAPVQPTGLEVKEAYLWDLRPATFSLTGVLTFTVPQRGAASHVELTVPENGEIRSVELGPLSSPGARIKKWRLSGKDNARQLRIALANPITGTASSAASVQNKFQIVLSIVPRLALDGPFVQLRLPTPLGVKPGEGELAYRLEGWQSIDKKQNLDITTITPDQFLKTWREAGQRDTTAPTHAYAFRRTGGNGLLHVGLQSGRPTARQEVVCKVQPAFTDVAVQLQVQGLEEEFSFLEYDVPPGLMVSHVSGPGIHHWSRTSATVQIWMLQSVRDASIGMTGWLKNALPPTGAKPGRFDLPRIRPVQPRLVASVIKVLAAGGCTVEPEKLQGLTPQKDPTYYRYDVVNPFYSGSFSIRPAPVKPVVRVLTSANLQNGIFAFRSRIDCQVLAPTTSSVVVTLPNWPADARLDVAQAEVKVDYRRKGNDHLWQLKVPAGRLWPLSLDVVGQMNTGPQQMVSIPGVDVADADYRGRWIVLAGAEPQIVDSKGLAKVAGASLNFWPSELKRLPRETGAWLVKDAAWMLRIQVPAMAAPLTWKLLWAEHEIHNQEGHWLHQANFFLSTRTSADVQVLLPSGARFQAACWGELFVNPRQDDAQHLFFKLPQDIAGQVLRVRWTYAAEDETSVAPRLGSARLLDAADVLIRTVLWRPPDMETPLDNPLTIGPLVPRAHGLMLLSSLLAEAAREQKSAQADVQIKSTQKLFAETLRHLDYDLPLSAKLHPDWGREIQAKRASVATLRRENQLRAAEGKYDQARKDAESTAFVADPLRQTTALPLPARGQPVDVAEELVTKDALPRSTAVSDLARIIVATQLVVVVFLALLLISFLSRLLFILPAFWPEQLLLVGIVGSAMLGVSIPGLVLILSGLVGRGMWSVRLLKGLMIRVFVRTEPAGHSSP